MRSLIALSMTISSMIRLKMPWIQCFNKSIFAANIKHLIFEYRIIKITTMFEAYQNIKHLIFEYRIIKITTMFEAYQNVSSMSLGGMGV